VHSVMVLWRWFLIWIDHKAYSINTALIDHMIYSMIRSYDLTCAWSYDLQYE